MDGNQRKLGGISQMRSVTLILLFIIVGCVLAAGCTGQIKNTNVNTTVTATVTPTLTFTSFSNSTNITNVTVTTGLKGPLRISIGSWAADLPVTVDNMSVGIVGHDKPMDLMLDEGNHIVGVCAGTMCLQENVTIQFAKQRSVDFEERLQTEVVFPNPTAQIVGSYPAGDQITVTVEFINPSSKDLTMSAEVRCGYSYIESRSNNRVGSVAQRIINANVKSGGRVMQTVNLELASGYSYMYDIPEISEITAR